MIDYNSYETRQEIADTWEITLPKALEVLFFNLSGDSYSEEAFVLFRQNGKLYEVNDSHCSCYGFDNWEPEETTAKALWHRLTEGGLGRSYDDDDYVDELKAIVLGLDPTLAPEAAPEDHLVFSAGGVKVAFTADQIPQIKQAIAEWEASRIAKWEGSSDGP